MELKKKPRLHFAPLLPPQLRDEFDRGTRTGFEETVQPHDVAYLLKDFLRSMPEPLLCRSLYGALLETQSECWSFRWSSLKVFITSLSRTVRPRKLPARVLYLTSLVEGLVWSLLKGLISSSKPIWYVRIEGQ